MAGRWTIDKEFHWEMGHRVHSQELSHQDLSISTECACKRLHGHSYTAKVFLSAENLDKSQMVTDFHNLAFFKRFLDDVLDHKFMIDINDPNFKLITGSEAPEFIGQQFTSMEMNDSFTESEILHRSSFVLVDFVPTSENICKYLKDYAQEKIGHIATVSAVELWETKKSHARYED